MIDLDYLQVNISQGARISVEGSKELCGNSSNCKAGGGSGGIVQIISRSGSIAPGAIILSGRSGDYRGAPEDGFLYIKGGQFRKIKKIHYRRKIIKSGFICSALKLYFLT